jgi:FO synthase subunit 2
MDRAPTLDASLAAVSAEVRAILEACLAGRELGRAEATRLCTVHGAELHALCMTADRLRADQVGDVVTYVVNRNINFTNVCVKACKFCAFSRVHRSEEAYFLDSDEVVRRALEAESLGATEVCIQAGLAPGVDGRIYVELCRAVKRAAPSLHIHACSPEEVKYGAELTGIPIRAYLEELKEAGLGSLPGTSAEVLDDGVRARIAPGRISSAEWIEVIRTAHELGIPTTSTIMFGHVESDAERVAHLDTLRAIQRETAGFTELVPLSFVHTEAPMFLRGLLPGLRPGPTGNDVIRLFAIARLMLGATIPNLQVSWVKEGLRQAQHLLSCGANDLGGTLMNESISTAAGSAHGQLQPPSALRRAIRDAGRVPAQRDTRYRLLRTFSADGHDDTDEPLDRVTDAEATFGSYTALTQDARFHFQRPVHDPRTGLHNIRRTPGPKA